MNLNTGPIKDWFGFTRRERRSTFSLLVIIVVVLVFRYTIPDSKITVKDISSEIIETENTAVEVDSSSEYSGERRRRTYLKKTFANGTRDLSGSKVRFALQQRVSKNSNSAVDINLSDTSALIKLPGIGPVLSARIIKYRTFLGGYARVEQLKEVYGLSEETYDMIKARVTADSSYIKRININTADFKDLSHVRYLEKYEINAILKYRQLKGKINTLSDIVENKLITNDKAQRIRPYIRFD